MSTRAIQYLKQHRVSFDTVVYPHAHKGAEYAAEATGYSLEMTVKTLVVDLGEGQYALALMPGDKQLSMKRLAKACRCKRAAMADTKTAQRITGYLVGGISPFGTKQKLPVVMEEGLLNYDRVLINAGQRGKLILIAPTDMRKTLGCKVASLTQS
jgi:Cys-tRNA(Pro)/Cys-tRNA(Cys) deacylase